MEIPTQETQEASKSQYSEPIPIQTVLNDTTHKHHDVIKQAVADIMSGKLALS